MNTFRAVIPALIATIVIGVTPMLPAQADQPTHPATATYAPAKAVVEPVERLVVTGATPAEAERVSEGLSMFAEAGLPLPPLHIEFFDSAAGCRGNSGLYQLATPKNEHRVDQIMICAHQMSVLLHELAHAWSRHFLTDDVRAQFTAHWGLENWRNKNDAHLDRGVERAAETIAMTLRAPELQLSDGVLRYVCSYELLTGNTTAIHSLVSC